MLLYDYTEAVYYWGFPGGSDGKASAYNERDPGSISGSGRSPGEGAMSCVCSVLSNELTISLHKYISF